MLTRMTDEDWAVVLAVFRAARSRRGDKGRDDRRFLEALHYFSVHNITWRALPAEFGYWNGVWKRFWRLSRAGVFEAFFDALAGMSRTAHLVQMFDATVVRAHVSAAGAKGGRRIRRSAAPAAASRPRSTSRSTSMACRSPSTRPRARRATAASSRSCSTSGRRSRPAPPWATRATTPRVTVPRRASGASAR
jgi:transposase